MKIGLIIADKDEYFSPATPLVSQRTISNITFFTHHFSFAEIVFAISGIGIANAARVTQMMIDHFQVDALANYGGVGAISPLTVGTLAVPSRIYYHDVITPWYSRGQIPGEPAFFVNELTKICENLPIKNKFSVANLGTGGAFIQSATAALQLQSELQINLFDMEAAAIAQVARANFCPVYIVKAVSDVIGKTNPRDINKLNISLEQVSQKAHDFLFEILGLFSNK